MSRFFDSSKLAGLLVASLAVFASLMATPGLTEAKSKGAPGSNCSMEQMTSPKAAACMKLLEQDMMTNSPITHALYCSSTGAMLCCQYDSNGVIAHSCEVQMQSHTPGTVDPNILGPRSLSPK